jgi:hypothetical protein
VTAGNLFNPHMQPSHIFGLAVLQVKHMGEICHLLLRAVVDSLELSHLILQLLDNLILSLNGGLHLI